MKRRTVAASLRSCHSRTSARRRNRLMLGQCGLSAMKAAKRLKFASPSGWRRMNHSTSLWAAGSPMVFPMAVASPVLPLRTRSIACLTAARSPDSGAAVAAGAGASVDFAALRRAAAACLPFLCAPWCLRPACLWPASAFLAWWVCLWRATAIASLENAVSKAKANKQVSGRKRWFIPWSPREPDGRSHEIARCTRLELCRSYHAADSQPSRLGNSVAKTWRTMELNVVPQHDLSRIAAIDFVGLEIAQGGAQDRRADATRARALHQVTNRVLALSGPAILDVDQH